MKKLFDLSFMALICLLVFTSCDQKQYALDRFVDFVEKTEKKAPEYTKEDWKEADMEYEKLIAELDKYEYSSNEAQRISELKGKYAGIKTKNTINTIIDGIDKAAKELKGTIEGFKDGLSGSDNTTLE